MDLEILRPKNQRLVMELVAEAGMDVSDWSNYAKGKTAPAANPKYCYEWSFVDSNNAFVIYSAWFVNLLDIDGNIQQHFNLREISERLKGTQKKRAVNADFAMQKAVRLSIPVRVILCDGSGTQRDEATLADAKVERRELDPEPWFVKSYDGDGNCVLVRGARAPEFIDQFSVHEEEASRVEVTSTAYHRDPVIRAEVLKRANGQCEWCGTDGFATAAGTIYLETHHIVPLSEGGVDSISNVIALCANDHRKAHFGKDRDKLKIAMAEKVSRLCGF